MCRPPIPLVLEDVIIDARTLGTHCSTSIGNTVCISLQCTHNVIRFVPVSTKFDICTVVSVNELVSQFLNSFSLGFLNANFFWLASVIIPFQSDILMEPSL
jgi:hypothetical protein